MSRFRRILVAIDGSEPAQNALDTALDLAEDLGGQIEALAVEGPLPRYAATVGEVDEALHERERARAREAPLPSPAGPGTDDPPAPACAAGPRSAPPPGADSIIWAPGHPVREVVMIAVQALRQRREGRPGRSSASRATRSWPLRRSGARDDRGVRAASGAAGGACARGFGSASSAPRKTCCASGNPPSPSGRSRPSPPEAVAPASWTRHGVPSSKAS